MDFMVHGAIQDPTAKLCPLGLPTEAMALRSPDRKMVPALCGRTTLLRCQRDSRILTRVLQHDPT